jgi:hypothetical protein
MYESPKEIPLTENQDFSLHLDLILLKALRYGHFLKRDVNMLEISIPERTSLVSTNS